MSGVDDKSQPLSCCYFTFRSQHAIEFARTQFRQERTNGFRCTLNAADTGRVSNEIKYGCLRCADAKRRSGLCQLLCRRPFNPAFNKKTDLNSSRLECPTRTVGHHLDNLQGLWSISNGVTAGEKML